MEKMIEWFELRHDADGVVDVLGLEVEELIEAFPERAKHYYDGLREAEGDYNEET